ncbi:MAG: hypothetical protein AAF458_19870 [Pseudomonadota bacterium]
MHNDTRFDLTEQHAGLGVSDLPAVFRLRQHFERPQVADIPTQVTRELGPIVARIKAGQSIAITGSSRGIANFQAIVAETVKAVRAAGGSPFVIPGMGSHGGATSEGQMQVLADTNGLTESSVGCPIRATMETVQVGKTASGFDVHQDKLAHDADGVIAINRVKPHTGFTETVESGLCKMLVIGLGKQIGASAIHQQSLRVPMGSLILDASKIIIESPRPKLLGGLAIVENAFKETADIRGIALDVHADAVAAEGALLERAYALLPRIPFDDMDALIVDEIGKNISGAGMDTNVIGKKAGLTTPRIGAIYVRGLTEATHGNATGIGNADLILRDTLTGVDLNSTYMNAFTAKRLAIGKIPMTVDNELQVMQILGNFRAGGPISTLRLVWIKNTSALTEMWATSALFDEAERHPRIEVLGAPAPLAYDDGLQLMLPA